MPRTIRRLGIAVAAAAAAAYATGAALVWRSPDRFVPFPESEAPQTPGMLGLAYREVWLRSGPNRALVHGWWLPNRRDAPAVLLLPGTGRSKAGLVHVAATMHAAGAAVLMIDYRGLGRSDRGPLTEASMYEDAEAAWHELRWHQPEGGRRYVYGHSLGAVPALELAARYPDVEGVVVEGAPTSIRALLRGSWTAALYPTERLLRGRFDAAAKLARLNTPLLVIHGKRDPIVPHAMGVELYVRASGRKSLLLVEAAAHSDAARVDAGTYQAALERLMPAVGDRALARLTPRAAPSRGG
jgi:fermentation-respiration switch protein FrsA (DUF1100 family)